MDLASPHLPLDNVDEPIALTSGYLKNGRSRKNGVGHHKYEDADSQIVLGTA